MESRDEGRPHDPDDPRGGGGAGGAPGTEGQEQWRKREEARKAKADQQTSGSEQEPPEEPGAFDRL